MAIGNINEVCYFFLPEKIINSAYIIFFTYLFFHFFKVNFFEDKCFVVGIR